MTDNNSIIMNGYVKFSTAKGKQLKKYYFTIDYDQNILSLYTDEKDETAHTFILLTQVSRIEKSEEYSSPSRYCIEIHESSPPQIYYLISKTDDVRAKLYQCLLDCMQPRRVINGKNITNIINKVDPITTGNGSPKSSSSLSIGSGRRNSANNNVATPHSPVVPVKPNPNIKNTLKLGNSRPSSIILGRNKSIGITSSNGNQETEDEGKLDKLQSNQEPLIKEEDIDDSDDNQEVKEEVVEEVKEVKVVKEKEVKVIEQKEEEEVKQEEVKVEEVEKQDNNHQEKEILNDQIEHNQRPIDDHDGGSIIFGNNNEEEVENQDSNVNSVNPMSNSGLLIREVKVNDLEDQKSVDDITSPSSSVYSTASVGSIGDQVNQNLDDNNNTNSPSSTEADPPGYVKKTVQFRKTPTKMSPTLSSSTSTTMSPIVNNINNNNNNNINGKFGSPTLNSHSLQQQPLQQQQQQFTRLDSSTLKQNIGLQMNGKGYFVISNSDQLQIIVGKSLAGDSSFAGMLVGPFKFDWKPLSGIWRVNEEGSVEVGPSTPPKQELFKRIDEKIEKALGSGDKMLASLLQDRKKVIEQSEEKTFMLKGGIVIGYRNDKWELLEAPITLTSNNTTPYHNTNTKLPNNQHQPQQQQQNIHHNLHHQQHQNNSNNQPKLNYQPNQQQKVNILTFEEALLMLQKVKDVVREIDSYFGHNTTLSEKSILGDDSRSKKIAILVRGKLSNAVANILSHGFHTTSNGVFKKHQHIWNFIESYRKMTLHATVSGLSLSQAIQSIEESDQLYKGEYDPNTHFRSFLCLGLNQHQLDQWLIILQQMGDSVKHYYDPHSFITNSELWKLFCQCFIPLQTLPFKLSLDYEFKLKAKTQTPSASPQQQAINQQIKNNNMNQSPLLTTMAQQPKRILQNSADTIDTLKSSISTLSTSIYENTSTIISNIPESFQNLTNTLKSNEFFNVNISSQNQQPQQPMANSEKITKENGIRNAMDQQQQQMKQKKKSVTFQKENDQDGEDSLASDLYHYGVVGIQKVQDTFRPISQKIEDYFDGK